jgi:hypothetical protein
VFVPLTAWDRPACSRPTERTARRAQWLHASIVWSRIDADVKGHAALETFDDCKHFLHRFETMPRGRQGHEVSDAYFAVERTKGRFQHILLSYIPRADVWRVRRDVEDAPASPIKNGGEHGWALRNAEDTTIRWRRCASAALQPSPMTA